MKYIVANWKMNGNTELAAQFVNKLNALKTENKIVVCPPAALIFAFAQFTKKAERLPEKTVRNY